MNSENGENRQPRPDHGQQQGGQSGGQQGGFDDRDRQQQQHQQDDVSREREGFSRSGQDDRQNQVDLDRGREDRAN